MAGRCVCWAGRKRSAFRRGTTPFPLLRCRPRLPAEPQALTALWNLAPGPARAVRSGIGQRRSGPAGPHSAHGRTLTHRGSNGQRQEGKEGRARRHRASSAGPCDRSALSTPGFGLPALTCCLSGYRSGVGGPAAAASVSGKPLRHASDSASAGHHWLLHSLLQGLLLGQQRRVQVVRRALLVLPRPVPAAARLRATSCDPLRAVARLAPPHLLRRAKHVSRLTVGRAVTLRQGPAA